VIEVHLVLPADTTLIPTSVAGRGMSKSVLGFLVLVCRCQLLGSQHFVTTWIIFFVISCEDKIQICQKRSQLEELLLVEQSLVQWSSPLKIKRKSVALNAAKLSLTRGSAMAEGPHDTLISRNSATTKYPYCVALFA